MGRRSTEQGPVVPDLQLNEKKLLFKVDFSLVYDILISVMRDMYKKNQMTLKEIERYMDAKRKREAKRDTFTLNGNTYTVNNDPKHQADQLAGYHGRNPK